MTDLDFDEIDRAVNSATTVKPVVDESSQPSEVNTSKDNTAQPVSVAEKPQPTLAGRRSTGQFMDVVHPSSNMRKSTLVMPERQPQPEAPIPAPAPMESTAEEQPTSKLTEPSTQKPENEWSDPVEIGEPKKVVVEEQKSNKLQPDEDDDIDKISQEITDELSKGSTDSLPDTPFISGTMVEKRPLGAFSDDKQQSDEETDKKDEEPADNPDLPDSNEAETAAVINEPIPDELEDKLIKIESDDISKTEELPKEPTAEEDAPKETPAPTPTPKPAINEPQAPIEATSINQQYKERPSTGDQTNGAIYDTEAYHKALMHPPKSKSGGWMWIVWILLLLVVGVIAGIAIYNYVLPLL